MDNTLQEIGQGDTRFGDKPMLTVYYEDLVADHEAIFREITSFLGLPYAKPRLTLKKQNPEPMSELVENFDELKAHFKGHRLEHYFE
ncbi:sulfotransferase [Candidatus Reidiella endopervernicosa]|uniref:Sulfotransferase n=1 Tax=Candidatus Reidiella endopervernicosa TaxID=2738883 RepID=A0A6N0I0I3_9GAMM|nr:sulfotransferase [Candidatus Reidiella endopervernicosa]QKQ28115.1 sulfotransferase [Candidatus Reidiella endopervernicosa]